jgi:hypothetical protein
MDGWLEDGVRQRACANDVPAYLLSETTNEVVTRIPIPPHYSMAVARVCALACPREAILCGAVLKCSHFRVLA